MKNQNLADLLRNSLADLTPAQLAIVRRRLADELPALLDKLAQEACSNAQKGPQGQKARKDRPQQC